MYQQKIIRHTKSTYSAGVLGIGQMQTWRDALTAYERLLEAAETLIQTSSTCSVYNNNNNNDLLVIYPQSGSSLTKLYKL